jgi:hypothetical protein
MVSKLAPGIGSYFDPTITIDNTVTVAHTGHQTEVLTDYAIQFIEDNQTGPFYLNLWYGAPHKPLEPPAEWAAMYPDTDEGRFAALISDADEEVGRLLDRLDALGLADQTLVVITSDNGGEPGLHGNDPADGPSNGGLNGAKRQVVDGGIRVPMMARWPSVIGAGTVDDSVLASFDVFPTFADAAGANLSNLEFDGESFMGVLSGSGPKLRTEDLFWELKANARFFDSPTGNLNTFAVRRDDWKLVFENETTYLFDMLSDPGETTNLAAAMPALTNDLLAAHRLWRLDTGLIPYEIAAIVGDASVSGDAFDFNGGSVVMEAHDLFNIDDGDFSFAATITPDSIGTSQFLASRGSSWRLLLRPNGRLLLEITDGTGAKHRLASGSTLQAGQEYDIAFTTFNWKSDPATIRLYVDGQLEAETNDLSRVMDSGARIQIGSNRSGNQPFIGGLRGLQFYSLNLTPDELGEVQAN